MSAHLFNAMPLPTQAEDYDFRMALEAEENGEAVEVEEVDADEVDGVEGEIGTQPAANVCKICLDGEARVGTMPCRHVAMCVACSKRIQDARCPICRTAIVSMTTFFFS